MTLKTSSPYLSYLYAALAEDFGLSLSTTDPQQAKAALYKARAESADPTLQQLSIHQSPFLPDTEVWLVKRRKKGSASDGQANSSTALEEPGVDLTRPSVSPAESGEPD